MMTRRASGKARPVLVTGGAGFVGTNLVDRLARGGERVLILDSLARPGVEQNLAWLKEQHGDRVVALVADVRDRQAVAEAVGQCGSVFHFAAQVAVTTSIDDPEDDFEVNARGTFNVLEAARRQPSPPPVLFCSTNKVYGGLEDIELRELESRYTPASPRLRGRGVAEDRPLDFCSPYGCSKGTADQYVLDYSRTYGVPTVVFRMSCIYGPHQHGTEDQGWVAHFMIRALRGEPLMIYGDGKQVRDVLYVDDLVEAFLTAREQVGMVGGRAYNIGGGPANSFSLLELIDVMRRQLGRPVELTFADWRLGDQAWYVSDISRFNRLTGWAPRVDKEEGVRRLLAWLGTRNGVAASAPPRRLREASS